MLARVTSRVAAAPVTRVLSTMDVSSSIRLMSGGPLHKREQAMEVCVRERECVYMCVCL